MATLDEPTRRDIEAFVYLEARLADESRYDEWGEVPHPQLIVASRYSG